MGGGVVQIALEVTVLIADMSKPDTEIGMSREGWAHTEHVKAWKLAAKLITV